MWHYKSADWDGGGYFNAFPSDFVLVRPVMISPQVVSNVTHKLLGTVYRDDNDNDISFLHSQQKVVP